ncbi:MAG: hypothetical protein R2681_03470 [Pyrinomonadaceae bacterium]
MKKNKFLFRTGLFLVIGGSLLIPVAIVGPLLFLGQDPEKLMDYFASEYSALIPIAAIAILISIPVIGSLMMTGAILIPLLFSMGSQRKILQSGLPADAKIIEVHPTNTMINNNPVVRFVLEVSTQSQAPFRAETSKTVSMIHLPSYQPGKMLEVKYQPGSNEVAIVGPKSV